MLLIVDGKKCYTKGRRGLPCATAWAAYGIDFCMMWTCYVNGVLICNDIFLFLDRGGLQIMYSCWIFGLRNNSLPLYKLIPFCPYIYIQRQKPYPTRY